MLMTRTRMLLLGLATLAACPSAAGAQGNDPIVNRAVAWLRAGGAGEGAGESALAALAMLKADVAPDDPALHRAMGILARRFEGSFYRPEKGSGAEIYEAAVVLLALSNHDPEAHRAQIAAAAQFLMGKQNANGSWDYQGRTQGDCSISQYAVLGLWEAENAGISVHPSTWDRAAQFYLDAQKPSGAWVYHPGESGEETVSMTAAGVGSLLICDRQLAPYRAPERVVNPLLTPIIPESSRVQYTASATHARILNSARGGIGWISANFMNGNPAVMGTSPHYALYGIERIGALADRMNLGKNDWYAEGRRYIASTQRADGGFTGNFGDGPSTSWAVLFLTKSTAKTLRKIQIRRLGSGTLIGGRGLPKDLSTISVAGGHVVARPMDGAVEGMLAVLEDPRVDDASSALAGLVARYHVEGPRALRPFEGRFRKLLTDPDQGVRRVAAWSLARTGDLATAPPLIEALRDPDPGVVAEAKRGLQLLSRKIDDLGPPDGATAEQKEAAVGRWRAWHESIRAVTTPAEADAEAAAPSSTKPAVAGRRGP